MKKAIKMIVSGTVQGVFFRQFVKEKADKLGLKGFVRNLDSGNVEIIVEGDDKAVLKMQDLCKQGPPHSQIRNVIVEPRNFSGDFKEFKILRM